MNQPQPESPVAPPGAALRALGAIDRVAAVVIIAIMAAMVVVVSLQVFLRYAFNTSIDWADDVDAAVPGDIGEDAREQRRVEHGPYRQRVGEQAIARPIFPDRERHAADNRYPGKGEQEAMGCTGGRSLRHAQ